jgi:hypothetical protein
MGHELTTRSAVTRIWTAHAYYRSVSTLPAEVAGSLGVSLWW